MSLSFGATTAAVARQKGRRGPLPPRSTWRRDVTARYTTEEDAIIVEYYGREPLVAIAKRLDRSVASVSVHSHYLVRTGRLSYTQRFYGRRWTRTEDDFILEHRGDRRDAWIARQLGRSATAVRDRAAKLGVGARDAYLTANQVAIILGIDSHKALRLAEMCVLPARKTVVLSGGGQMVWRVEVGAFERFLRQQSAWFDWRRITDEPWRGIARAAVERDPWLTTRQAGLMAGCCKDWIQQEIRRGRLEATAVLGGGGHRVYRIRRSAVQRWMAWRVENPRVARRSA